MSVLPSPPPDASATRRGLVSTTAQEVAGPKTFVNDSKVNDTLEVGAASPTHTVTIEGDDFDVQVLPVQVGGFGEAGDVAELFETPGLRRYQVFDDVLSLSHREGLSIDLEVDAGDDSTTVVVRADQVQIPGPLAVTSVDVTADVTVGGVVNAVGGFQVNGVPLTSAVETVDETTGLDLVGTELQLKLAADGVPGALSTTTQEISGEKTFLDGLLGAFATLSGALTAASAAIGGALSAGTATLTEVVTQLVRASAASLVLRSSVGASASDVALRLGTEVSDGSTHASAKLVQIGTGIGGTFVEKFYVTKTGAVVPGALTVGGAVSAASLSASGAGAVATGTGGVGVTASSFPLAFSAGWGLVDDGSAEAFRYISTTIFSNLATTLAVWRNSNTHTGNGVMRIRASGRIDQAGKVVGTVGNETVNKPIGVATIGAGTGAVFIQNSLVTANSHVTVSPYGIDATCKEIYGSPAFIGGFWGVFIGGSDDATSNLAVAWEVKGIL